MLLFPSMVVAITIRFDDSYHVLDSAMPAPQSSTDLANGNPMVFGPPNLVPLIDRGAVDQLTQIGAQLPKSGSVELPGFRQAGHFEFTFDFRNLPIDPRLIQAMSIDAYLGLVNPKDFATGIVRPNSDGSRSSILKPTDDDLLMSGVVDDHSFESTDKGFTLHISGRDLRGILIDGKLDSRVFEKLDLTKPIDEVVNQILHKTPLLKDVVVSVNPDDWPNQQLPNVPINARVRRGADGQGKPVSVPQGPGDKISPWDLITKYCFLVGAIPYFQGRQLRIRPARSLFDQQKGGTQSAGPNYDPNVQTPFLRGFPRNVRVGNPPSTENLKIRRFVFGRNLINFKFERKYGGIKTPVVQVPYIDTTSKKKGLAKVQVAEWPAKNLGLSQKEQQRVRTTTAAASGNASQTDILRIPVAGIRSKEAALEIAHGVWEEIGRGEVGGSCSTKDFTSFNTFELSENDVDPDVVRMRPGDAVQVMVDTRALSSNSPLVSEVTDHSRRSFNEEVDEVAKRLAGPNGKTDKNLAKVLVATARNSIAELLDTFRVSTIKFSLAEGGAIGIDFDFQNFIVPRYQVASPSLGQNKQAVKRTAARST